MALLSTEIDAEENPAGWRITQVSGPGTTYA